jgi:hypothetical protein
VTGDKATGDKATGDKWARPAAGREPAAAALLEWLADDRAPGLCVVTGDAGRGKSSLLAWLVAHGTRPGTVSRRRVHGFVPLAGQTATTTAWMLADQLYTVARTPGELLAHLAADLRTTVLVLPELHAADDPGELALLVREMLGLGHVRIVVEVRSGTEQAAQLTSGECAVMDLDLPQWTDPERLAAWTAEHRELGASVPAQPGPEEAVDLDDPAAVCAADPWRVSVGYERSDQAHGGLRGAWLRAGMSLTRDQAPGDRAVVLLSALGDDADPRVGQTLTGLAAGAAWQVVWRRVAGDVQPPWPGPARALAVGRGPAAACLAVADHRETVRLLDLATAHPAGRLATAVPRPTALAAHPDGAVTRLGAHGRMHTESAAPQARTTGLFALIEDGPSPRERLLAYLAPRAREMAATAVAAADGIIVLADEDGAVHAFDAAADASAEAELVPNTATLHKGPVVALAAVDLPVAEDGTIVPLVYSGGADGTVRAWSPQHGPLDTPPAARPCPVTALSVAHTPAGLVMAVAWADGHVEHHTPDADTVRTFRPGSGVHSLAVTLEGDLILGTEQSLVRLRPA